MKFEIITNSQSHTGYDIEDKTFRGIIDGLVCGWQFEFRKGSEYGYKDVTWSEMLPDEMLEHAPWYFESCTANGWEPTGRVVFRGYAREWYDAYEHEWFVEEVA